MSASKVLIQDSTPHVSLHICNRLHFCSVPSHLDSLSSSAALKKKHIFFCGSPQNICFFLNIVKDEYFFEKKIIYNMK